MFSSETTEQIEIRFYMEYLCLGGIKVYISDPGHLVKTADMPIYGLNPLKILFSRTINWMTLKLDTQQKGLEPNKNYLNDDPGLTLTYFTTRSTLFI